jgi:hypothetical protein
MTINLRMLSVAYKPLMLSVILVNAVMLSVVMLNVVDPMLDPGCLFHRCHLGETT